MACHRLLHLHKTKTLGLEGQVGMIEYTCVRQRVCIVGIKRSFEFCFFDFLYTPRVCCCNYSKNQIALLVDTKWDTFYINESSLTLRTLGGVFGMSLKSNSRSQKPFSGLAILYFLAISTSSVHL